MTTWTHLDNGTYSRPLGPMERAYVKMVHSTKRFGKEDFVINFVMKFTQEVATPPSSATPIEEKLRLAWSALRFEHPMIATELGENEESLVYMVPRDTTALESWLTNTLIVRHGERRLAGDIFADLGSPRLMELHFLPSSSELILRSSHWRIDGAGCSFLMDHFFELLAADRGTISHLTWGQETIRLPPVLEDALLLPEDVPEETKKWSREWIGDLISGAPSIGIPCQAGTAPGRPSRELLTLDEEDTANLVARCKGLSLTVTAALHAAAIIQTRIMTPTAARNGGFTDVLMSDLRMYMPEPYNGRAYAAIISSMPQLTHFSSLGHLNYLEIARTVMQRSKEYDMPMLLRSLRAASAAFEKVLDAGATSPQIPSMVPPVTSSLGVLEKYLRPQQPGFTIDRVHSFSAIQSAQPTLCLNSWLGHTSLDLVYNDAYITPIMASEFVQGVWHIASVGLQISEA
ncbi:hypothetical protein S40288_09932 [Stachybotrys chartarum IBT 40288]|nr:hypothetical protein S40288_09932 [Stachybotrys chartarum IBT 40288]